MFSRFGEMDHSVALLNELRRRMNRVWEDVDPSSAYDGKRSSRSLSAAAWPRINLFDGGANLIMRADIPGLSDKEVQVTLNESNLSISGERKISPPEGYGAQRQERESVRFSRSLALPCKVNPDHASAFVKDGVLTITLGKVAEAQPRRVAIEAQ